MENQFAAYRSDGGYHALITPGRVFQGTLMDDLFCALGRAPSLDGILVLGASLAACLLPFSLFREVHHVTLVDVEEIALPLNDDFEIFFSIEKVQTDAMEFLQSTERKYEFIYVDLYSDHSSYELLQDPTFIELLRSRLAAKGVVAINCFDIASYAFPEIPPTISTATMAALGNVFPEVWYLKHRRNVLIYAGTLQAHVRKPHSLEHLSEADRYCAEALAIRASDFRRFTRIFDHRVFLAQSPSPRLYSSIQELFEVRALRLYEKAALNFPQIRCASDFSELSLRSNITAGLLSALTNSPFLRWIFLTEIAALSFDHPLRALDRLEQIRCSIESQAASPYDGDILSNVQSISARNPHWSRRIQLLAQN